MTTNNKEMLDNDLYPVTPFDRAYAVLLNDIIASISMKRRAANRLLHRHSEWIEFRRSAASCDEELMDNLFSIVSTAYDDDYTSPTVRDESHDASWGRIVEVLP